MRIDELTQQAADHLAGRPVKIVWSNPPAAQATGQAVKTNGGDLIIYVGNLEGVNSRFKTYLHELAHARNDYDFIPRSSDHRRPAASIPRTTAARQAWRADPREERANRQAADWLDYAERNAYKYCRVGRSGMICKLLALLDWRK